MFKGYVYITGQELEEVSLVVHLIDLFIEKEMHQKGTLATTYFVRPQYQGHCDSLPSSCRAIGRDILSLLTNILQLVLDS